MSSSFNAILQSAVAPVVLISGVGLLLLSINNRYAQAMAKTRSFLSELQKESNVPRRANLTNQISILLKRCKVLRVSIAFIVLSTVFSGFIVFASTIANIWAANLDLATITLLLLSCGCILVGNVMFFVDIIISLQAIKLEVDFALNHKK